MKTKERLTDNVYHTKENKERACYIQEPRLQAIYDKLFEIEDLEDELGIDLLTLFKVWNAVLQKEYLWTKYNDQVDATDDVEIGDEVNGLEYIYFYWPNGKHLALYLEEYGKTWALTKEELE